MYYFLLFKIDNVCSTDDITIEYCCGNGSVDVSNGVPAQAFGEKEVYNDCDDCAIQDGDGGSNPKLGL